MMTKHDSLYMEFAILNAKKSHAERLKVGGCFVRDDRILSHGWNGTAPGEDNCCENDEGFTKPSVIHSEMNGILRAARDGESLRGSTLYCTHSPCEICAWALISVGIVRLVYIDVFRDEQGIELLKSRNILVEKYETQNSL